MGGEPKLNAKVELSESKANPKLIEIFNRLMAMPKGAANREMKGSGKVSAKKRADSAKK
jgi:hypothetical protein